MNRKILIVDDDRDILQAFKKQLDLLGGYDTDLATGGQEGLDKMAQNNYELVLLDLIMPELDGIEVLTTVQSDPAKYKKVPIIVVTNVTSERTRKEVQELGALDYIVKTDTDIDVVIGNFFNGRSIN